MANSIKISTPGSDATSATGAEILLGAHPLIKLDTANNVSFRTYTISFITEPPNPAPGAISTTLLYTASHGYDYVPRTWMQLQNLNPTAPATPAPGTSTTTYRGFAEDTGGALFSSQIADGLNVGADVARVSYTTGGGLVFSSIVQAALVLSADTQNIYFTLYKIRFTHPLVDPVPLSVILVGVTIRVRVYVFVEAMEF